MTKSHDQILRSITANGAFRVVTIVTTNTVEAAVAAQSARGEVARWLGELITGSILVREAMSPESRVQMLVKDSDGRTQLVADSHPAGWNRGMVTPGQAERPSMGERAVLEVLYTLPNKILQQGVVRFADDGDVSTALMTYMQESEQITSMIAVLAIVDSETRVRAAGGYLVQLLPDASLEALSEMTDRLGDFQGLAAVLSEADVSVDRLREVLIGEIPAKEMARMDLRFGCSCDRTRIFVGLTTLSDEDIAEITNGGEPIEATCDACGTRYQLSPEELVLLRTRGPAPN